MARSADVIGIASVQAIQPRKDESTGLVYTDFTLRFTEVWKGSPPDPFILTKAGGKVGTHGSAVVGREYRLDVGETLVVFSTGSLSNRFAVIGLRQGLYRVGEGADPMLFRVSEFPEKAGASSTLRLAALRDQVGRVVPRPEAPSAPGGTPGDSRAVPKPGAEGERSPQGSQDSSPSGASSSQGSGSRVWAAVALGAVAVLGLLVILRRK